ncbi:MAG: hypothetical protein ACREJ0_05730 [Geminicoccaceae bacterium]
MTGTRGRRERVMGFRGQGRASREEQAEQDQLPNGHSRYRSLSVLTAGSTAVMRSFGATCAQSRSAWL